MKKDNLSQGCRKIVKFDFTVNPTREFVRQRIIDFSYDYPDKKYLIHDNAAQFTTIDFNQYDIQGVNGIPNGYIAATEGEIIKEPILGGLCHHYYRSNA